MRNSLLKLINATSTVFSNLAEEVTLYIGIWFNSLFERPLLLSH